MAVLFLVLALVVDGRWAAQQAPRPATPAIPAQAIGTYTNGCLAGGVPLAKDGRGYRVLHLGRRRYYGHPSLVDYVRRLGRGVHKAGLGVVWVGDLAQPRGGPTPTGHRSHQTGLDVDVGYVVPAPLQRRPLRASEREALHAPAVVDLATRAFTPAWKPAVLNLLALAAADPLVARIFVHPVIKRELCARTKGKRPALWLTKIRPWWGHHDHFHVRLACPPDSPECRAQDPLPPGDGCDALAWWFTDDARATREKRATEEVAPPVLPVRCDAVLDQTGAR